MLQELLATIKHIRREKETGKKEKENMKPEHKLLKAYAAQTKQAAKPTRRFHITATQGTLGEKKRKEKKKISHAWSRVYSHLLLTFIHPFELLVLGESLPSKRPPPFLLPAAFGSNAPLPAKPSSFHSSSPRTSQSGAGASPRSFLFSLSASFKGLGSLKDFTSWVPSSPARK